jgi:hypothetical protein
LAALTGALVASQGATGCVFAPQDDCALTHGFPGCKGALASTNGSSGGAPSSSSSTGTGGKPQCSTNKDCPPPEPPAGYCASLAISVCVMHTCGLAYMPGDAPSQQYGSCKRNVCDAQGQMKAIEDDTNVFDDGNPCTTDVCPEGGAPQNIAMVGPTTTCMYNASTTGYCEQSPDPSDMGFVVCSQCDPTVSGACTGGWTCDKGKCVPPTCTNGVKDFGETDVDCGGLDCLPCGTDLKCLGAPDCFSGICIATTKTCAAPMCNDNVQNGQETDIDCGGPICAKCAPTNHCRAPLDCTSKVCKPGPPGTPDVCQAPSCTDGVQNGDETGVDCGGSCPPCG